MQSVLQHTPSTQRPVEHLLLSVPHVLPGPSFGEHTGLARLRSQYVALEQSLVLEHVVKQPVDAEH